MRPRPATILAAVAMTVLPLASPGAVASAAPTPMIMPGHFHKVSVRPVQLGEARDLAVLGATGVINTDRTTITGDVDVTPGRTVSGFPPGAVRGQISIDTAEARRERAAAIAAYNDAASRTPTATLPSVIGDNTVLPPGVYNTPGGVFTLMDTLRLDAHGDVNAVWIFQASSLMTMKSSNIDLLNGAQAENVFWQVSDDATLGLYGTFRGNLLVRRGITVDRWAAVFGRTMALDQTLQIIGTDDGPHTRITQPDDPPTATTLTSSPNPSGSGQTVTFIAKVAGDFQGFTPKGQVLFRDGDQIIGSGTIDASGAATFRTARLAPGDHPITAVYVGVGTFANEAWVQFLPSQSPVLVQHVTG
ncbi:ice-binding family protein [Sphaerisporangium fuscum]|uniref:ice-binding family protein n=1 Tax=Sphaerisporangium fuscum TaxID=2835868 RepID=UPI001BDC757B|nr:ice-binding family protein [Sphaerisporangium fuscum]